MASATTSSEKERAELLADELFDVRRSVRYHMHRCRFYDGVHDMTTALSVLVSMGVIYCLLSGALPNDAIAFLAGLVGALSIFDLVVGSTRKARLHSTLAVRFIDLEKRLVSKGEASLEAVRLDRLDVEKDEPPVLRVLNAICYNEVVLSMRYKQSDRIFVGFFQRLFANFFDFRPDKLARPDQIDDLPSRAGQSGPESLARLARPDQVAG